MRVVYLAFPWVVPVIVAEGTSSATSSLAPQTATLTTLPPAQPSSSSNDTNPCDFTDQDSLLERVVSDWQGYNISLLVETCPGVCILIYGDGNPDVSGVGVMVSYIVQFISTILAGPVLAYLLVLEGGCGDRFDEFLAMIISDVVPATDRGNNWIMFSVLVASAIRVTQQPPVFEIDFILYLLWFQWIMAVARTMSSFAVSRRDDRPDHEGCSRRYAWSFCWSFVTLIFTFVMALSAGYPSGAVKSDALVIISRFCAYENDLPIPMVSEDSKEQNSSRLTWWQQLLLVLGGPFIEIGLVMVITIVGAAVLFVLAWFFGIWAAALAWIWAKFPRMVQRVLVTCGVWSVAGLAYFVVALPLLLWLAVCVCLLVFMQSARQSLQMALGKQYQDSYWGFGQVTIVVMLLPPVFDVLGRIIRFFTSSEKKEKGASKHETQPMIHTSTSNAHDVNNDDDDDDDDDDDEEDGHLAFEPDESPDPLAGHTYNTNAVDSSSIISTRGAQTGVTTTSSPPDGLSFGLTQRTNTFPRDEHGNIIV